GVIAGSQIVGGASSWVGDKMDDLNLPNEDARVSEQKCSRGTQLRFRLPP
ncbi:MAG: hypothetical protein ACI81R_002823, partial [Bradymonadia bacterium]